MKAEKLKVQLESLDQQLQELDQSERDFQDIIKNIRGAIICELSWVSQYETIGRDDASDIFWTIMSTQERITFLKENPEFNGDLIALRAAMGEKVSKVTEGTDKAPDTERDRAHTMIPPSY